MKPTENIFHVVDILYGKKDEIANQIDDVTNIRVTRVAGCISIVGDYYSGGKKYEVVTRFKKFGITRVTPPVED